MTQTSYDELLKLLRRIPNERWKNVWLIPLLPNNKNPIGGSWTADDHHYDKIKCKNWMKNGGNIGVVALPRGIMMIDIDTDKGELLASGGLLAKLDRFCTLKVLTRSGGLHYYFLNDGKYDTQNLIEDGNLIGELRANVSYVLAPGSYAEGAYKVIADNPIKPFPDTLKSYFVEGIKQPDDKGERTPKRINGIVGVQVSEETKLNG